MQEAKIAQLSAQKSKIIAEASAALEAGKLEEYRTLVAEADAVQSDLDSLAQIAALQGNKPAAPVGNRAQSAQLSPEQQAANRNRAYRHLLRNGYRPGSVEQRDITISGTDGALASQDFDKAYTAAQKFAGPIATLVKYRKVASSGAPTKFTSSDDTASTMSYLPEGSNAAVAEAEPSTSSTVPGTDTLITMVKYSFQELDDANDLEGFIRDLAFTRAARATEYALTLGKDSGTNTQLPNSPNGGLLASVSQGAVTPSLSAGIAYQNLVSLAGSVDHQYYINGAFMASPSVHNYFLSQEDGMGRPYYHVDPETGLLMIAGKPLYVNNAMPAYNTPSSPVVLFGDFSRAYAYLDGGGLQIKILAERFADILTGAAVIYQRLGATPLVSGAVKSLVTAAS